jgi:hypothetical protein
MAAFFASSFLTYIFYKLSHYATLELFGTACSEACKAKLRFCKISPIAVRPRRFSPPPSLDDLDTSNTQKLRASVHLEEPVRTSHSH